MKNAVTLSRGWDRFSYRNEKHGANSKSDEESLGDVLVNLNLDHGHHGEAGEEGGGAAGGLQLGPAQLKHGAWVGGDELSSTY